MQQRLESLRGEPIGFAHRGARDRRPENTLEAFVVALELGATGLESDVWVTSDGAAVLDHDGVVRSGLRTRTIADVARRDLPVHIPGFGELLGMLPAGVHVSLDIKHDAAVRPVLDEVSLSGVDPGCIWLCSPHTRVLESVASSGSGVHAVHSVRTRDLTTSLEKHCAILCETGVAAVNLHHSEWNGGNVVLVHRFGLLAFAWDIQYPEAMVNILRMGVDGVYSDHADMMMHCIRGRMS